MCHNILLPSKVAQEWRYITVPVAAVTGEGDGSICAIVFQVQTRLSLFFFFLVSALLRDCSLCWDPWNGT